MLQVSLDAGKSLLHGERVDPVDIARNMAMTLLLKVIVLSEDGCAEGCGVR